MGLIPSLCFAGAFAISTNANATISSVYSYWIKNLSQDADPDHLYNHEFVKLATSGNHVHVVWRAFKNDFSGNESIFYRRSTDGGNTFSKPVELVRTVGQHSLQMPAEWNNLVVSGPFVHLFYAEGTPRLVYLRSSDYGKTFDEPKVIGGFLGGEGVYAYANQDNLYMAWAANTDQSSDVYCAYSSNGGASYDYTRIAHDDNSDGAKKYRYSVEDLAGSGSNVYVLHNVQDENWFSSQEHLYLLSSTDGCKKFKPARRVNTKAVNGGYYAPRIQNAHYSPNLAANGDNVDVVWVNVDDPGSFDGWAAQALRTRTSHDAGSTLGAPKTLYTYPSGYNNGAVQGLETIARNKASVYITTTMQTAGHSGTYLWRSIDGGASWSKEKLIMDGGWWPMLGIDKIAPSNVYVANGWLFKSDNSGGLFNGGFSPQLDFGGYTSPRFVIDGKSQLHLAGQSNPRNQYLGNEILYRRLVRPSAPVAGNYALNLKVNGTEQPVTGDYLQIPSTQNLQFGKAMTLEFWVKRQSDDWSYYEHLVSKNRWYGESSFELGAWGDFQIYGRLVTTGSTDGYYGNWLGSGVNLEKGIWTHIAMTYNDALTDNNWRIYVDGELRGQATLHGRIVTDKGRLLIGDPTRNSNHLGSGMVIDELRLWSVARSQAQIKNAMNRALTDQDAGVALYLNFNKSFKDMSKFSNEIFPKYKERFVLDSPF